MRFEHTNTYSAASDRVLTMLTDAAFRERVCLAQKAMHHAVQVTGGGVGATVVVDRTQSMTKAPSVATRMVGDRVRVVQTERWGSAEEAELEIEIPGRPGHMSGSIRLRPRPGGGCDQVVTGEIKVHLPLVGGKLESLVATILVKALVREGEVGRAWLAEAR